MPEDGEALPQCLACGKAPPIEAIDLFDRDGSIGTYCWKCYCDRDWREIIIDRLTLSGIETKVIALDPRFDV